MVKRYQHKEHLINTFSLRLASLAITLIKYPKLITPRQREELKPLFIVGSGRSGNTLLRKILCRHPDIAIPPESYILPTIIKKFIRYNALDWSDIVKVVLGEFTNMKEFHAWQTDLSNLYTELSSLPRKERSLAKIINSIYFKYAAIHYPKAKIWGDKTPFNLLRLKWINKVFPKAKYINIFRDGRDVVSSYNKAGLYDDLDQACLRWNDSVEIASKVQRKLNSKRFISIYYENLVHNLEKTVRSLCEFLEIEYSSKMLSEVKGENLGDTYLRHHENVSKPVFTSSIGNWKKDMDINLQKYVTDKLKKNLKKLNYIS